MSLACCHQSFLVSQIQLSSMNCIEVSRVFAIQYSSKPKALKSPRTHVHYMSLDHIAISYSGLLLSLPLITIPAGFAWECAMSQLTVAYFVQVLVSRDSQSTLSRVRRCNRRLSSLFVEDRHTELLMEVLAKWRNHAWA